MAKRPTTATKRKAKPTPADRASSKPRTVDPGASGGDVARPAAVDPAVLAEAFDAFTRELDAATIPTPDGGRKVHTVMAADLLSRAAARLSSMLAGTVVAGIGDGLPVDAHLMTAFESANRLLALTVKQHNERRLRFAFGDVLTAEQVESIESARRLLAFRADRLRAPDAGEAGDPEFTSIGQFPTAMHARIKMAARPNRKTKRVRKRMHPDGTVLYSMADARMWWAADLLTPERD